MTFNSPSSPWIHIGNCPICGNGLVRLRCSTNGDGEQHLYALCDECEGIWFEPDTSTQVIFPDPDEALCPYTDHALYGPQTRWATLDDIRGTVWEAKANVDPPLDDDDQTEDPSRGYFVTADDAAGSLDVPSAVNLNQSDQVQQHPATLPIEQSNDDWGYGQDEPRPGC